MTDDRDSVPAVGNDDDDDDDQDDDDGEAEDESPAEPTRNQNASPPLTRSSEPQPPDHADGRRRRYKTSRVPDPPDFQATAHTAHAAPHDAEE